MRSGKITHPSPIIGNCTMKNQIKINFKLMDGYRNNKQYEQITKTNRTFEAWKIKIPINYPKPIP